MLETEINLTEREQSALQEISRRTGKTEHELIREAVDQLIAQLCEKLMRLVVRKILMKRGQQYENRSLGRRRSGRDR